MPSQEQASPHEMSCPTCHEQYPGGLSFCPKDGARLMPAPSGSAPPRESSLVGQVLADRYRIVRKIGEGGMGEVFEAQHVYIDKRYAIKTLRPEITTNPEAVARFHQEARSASTIGHENIIEIDDFGRLPDGGVYLAMEFLDGQSLAERMKGGPPLGPEERLEYMIQVCRGLAAAHDKGIIHRDMKPENIFLVRRQGKTIVKVLDFGIAKVTSDNAHERLTQTGAIFGTPYYMSPEQALGRPLDGRTDIYSVGVILYEVFAGKVPFEGESFMGILSQHITAEPQPLAEAAPFRHVPKAIEQVIFRALAKDPAQRFPTMHVMVEVLERIQAEPEAEASVTVPRPTVSRLAEPGRLAGPPPVEQELEPALESLATERGDGGEEPALELEERPGVPAAAHPHGRLITLLAVGLLLVGGAAVGALLLDHARPKALRGATLPAGVVGSSSAGSTGGGATAEVVLDSVPTGAKVFASGQLIAETPDAVKVPTGKTLEVLIRKEGFVPRQVVLDPAHEPKLVVRLERERRGGGGHRLLPHLLPGSEPAEDAPPTTAPAPTPLPSPTRRPAPVRTRSDDIYQPMPAPPRRATPAPARDVMNPYN